METRTDGLTAGVAHHVDPTHSVNGMFRAKYTLQLFQENLQYQKLCITLY